MEVGRFFNQESMDLNALYQQDIDLGVNWPMFEPVKSVKDVGLNGKIPFDPKDYIVDGETGEYLPIPIPQKIETQQMPVMGDGETGQTSDFNIEEFLDSSINSGTSEMNVQSVNEHQFQQVQSTPETINTELWDDIATLSEAYLALDSGEFAHEGMSDTSSPMEETVQFSPVNQYQSDVYGNQAQIQMPPQQKTLPKEQYFGIAGSFHNFPTPPYAEQSESPPPTYAHPTSVTFPPENKSPKQFGPADIEEAKIAEMLLTQQSELLAQLDTVSQVDLGPGNPPPINAEEVTLPGSWFFGGDEPANNFSQVLTDLDAMNNMHNQPGPYVNPPNPLYVPPPIQNQARVSMVSESDYDSDFSEVGINHMDIEMIEQVEPTSIMMPGESTQEETGETKQQRKQRQRESRDLKKARELNIQLTMDEMINSPVEEYNELLAHANLNPAQQALVRDIRRRGKNKVAAQNCRKRKIETISSMEIDIGGLNMKRQELINKQKELEDTKNSIQGKYNQLYKHIFNSLRDETGRPYDQNRYSLQQVEGAIILVPGNRGNRMGGDSKGTVAFFDLSKVKIEKEI